MRTLYLLIVIYVALITSGCSNLNTPSAPEKPQTPVKDPINVSLETKTPARPYKVLGQANVSKFNAVGIKRQEAIIRDLMRQEAVSLGGDAVIALKRDSKAIHGTVISYEKILV